jgi:hypothetical protein
MRSFTYSLTRLALFFSPALALGQSPPSYSVELLANTHGLADLNAAGQVVGVDPLYPANERGWVAGPDVPLTYLPLPVGRISSRVCSINDLGVIVGAVSSETYAEPSFGAIAAVWTPDGSGGYTVQELDKLPGDLGSLATALNDLGDIVGYSQGGMFRRAVWFNSSTGIQDLTSTGAFDPKDINEQRVVVCYSQHCSRLDLDTMVLEDLGIPQGSYTNTLGGSINESNQVAGVAILSTGTHCDRQAARYTDGVGWEVFGGCGSNNGAGSINDLGDMTMWWNVSSIVYFEGIGSYAIESLIDAPVGQWYTGAGATGLINASRQIAIFAQNTGTGESGIVLLRPITYVGTGMCAGDGLDAPCPCGNESGVGEFNGCLNSSGTGARLLGTGSSSVAQDDLVLNISQGPAHQTALLFQGGVGGALPFFDGLRCAANPLTRLQVVTLDASGAASSSVSIVTKGNVVPGMTRAYQAWFRDPMGPCGSGANLSAGLQITWF